MHTIIKRNEERRSFIDHMQGWNGADFSPYMRNPTGVSPRDINIHYHTELELHKIVLREVFNRWRKATAATPAKPLPPGEYNARIATSELKDGVLSMSMQILDDYPDEVNTVVFDSLTGISDAMLGYKMKLPVYKIGVRFDRNNQRAGQGDVYYYKWTRELKKGERVIVNSPYTGFTTVTVVTCGDFPGWDEVDAFKWIVSEIDATRYVELEKTTSTLRAERIKQQRIRSAQTALERAHKELEAALKSAEA